MRKVCCAFLKGSDWNDLSVAMSGEEEEGPLTGREEVEVGQPVVALENGAGV